MPNEFSPSQLKKVGVAIVGQNPWELQCDGCGARWHLKAAGLRLKKGYWKCPNGCNGEGAIGMISKQGRILCVDDDQDTRELIVAFLADYEVSTASTAAAGLALAQSNFFDLYLLDNWLPDGSGIDLCRQIRSIDPNAPVIFCSGVAYERDRHEALAAGAQLYVVKPADFSGLRHTIARLITKTRSQSIGARIEEITAMSDGIKERLGRAETLLDQAHKTALKLTAYQAFAGAGGTRAEFERLWPDVVMAEFPNWAE